MFHALGFLHATIGAFLGSTLVLHRKFKPPIVLEDIEKHKVTAVVVVPVMLSRMLEALEQMDTRPDLSSLRIIFLSGSALGADVAERALNEFGPVVYNMYGSTEIAFATIAEPRHLEFNSSTAGPVVKGVKVKIFDDNGKELPQGEVGKIFVGTSFPFEGYTGGGGKQIINGMLASEDLGYFDEHGLLYISGRDDEMIVSGGENFFPAEVEDLISGHPDVADATAIGVEDKEWGQRLRAFVVKKKDTSIDEDTIKKYVRDRTAKYKVPREVVFLESCRATRPARSSRASWARWRWSRAGAHPSNPVAPSSCSRRMSSCPAWRAVSSIKCTYIQRNDSVPSRSCGTVEVAGGIHRHPRGRVEAGERQHFWARRALPPTEHTSVVVDHNNPVASPLCSVKTSPGRCGGFSVGLSPSNQYEAST
jgi:acyl-CoA synthetase (AMP-forming)/AMP-acid ligase II